MIKNEQANFPEVVSVQPQASVRDLQVVSENAMTGGGDTAGYDVRLGGTSQALIASWSDAWFMQVRDSVAFVLVALFSVCVAGIFDHYNRPL